MNMREPVREELNDFKTVPFDATGIAEGCQDPVTIAFPDSEGLELYPAQLWPDTTVCGIVVPNRITPTIGILSYNDNQPERLRTFTAVRQRYYFDSDPLQSVMDTERPDEVIWSRPLSIKTLGSLAVRFQRQTHIDWPSLIMTVANTMMAAAPFDREWILAHAADAPKSFTSVTLEEVRGGRYPTDERGYLFTAANMLKKHLHSIHAI